MSTWGELFASRPVFAGAWTWGSASVSRAHTGAQGTRRFTQRCPVFPVSLCDEQEGELAGEKSAVRT